jgi:hypothetical protein
VHVITEAESVDEDTETEDSVRAWKPLPDN